MKYIAQILVSFFIVAYFCLPYAAAQTYTPAPINPLAKDARAVDQPLKLPGANAGDPSTFIQESFLPSITSTIIGIAGGLSLLFVIIAGIQILTAYNNEEKIATAKKTLTWALAGLIIAILSYSIVQIIVSIKLK